VVYFVDDLSGHSGVYIGAGTERTSAGAPAHWARARACAVVLQVIASCSTQNAIQAAIRVPITPLPGVPAPTASSFHVPLLSLLPSHALGQCLLTQKPRHTAPARTLLCHFIQNLDIRQVARMYIRQPSYSSKTKAFLMSRLPTVLGPETGRL